MDDGKGQTYRDQIFQRFRCPNCEADLAVGSLEAHRQVQHGGDRGGRKYYPPPTPGQCQDLPDILPVGSTQHCLPGGGVTREGGKLQHTTGAFLALPHAVHGSDPVGEEPPPTLMSQV